jgi:hypothetical protein
MALLGSNRRMHTKSDEENVRNSKQFNISEHDTSANFGNMSKISSIPKTQSIEIRVKGRMSTYADRNSLVVDGDRNSFIGKSHQKIMDKQYGSTQRPPRNSPRPD